MYNKRVWLNPMNSYASSNVVAFDGDITYRSKSIRSTFLTVSDCNVSVTLNKNDGDTIEDFIRKMELLKSEIGLFIDHLEENV